MSVSTKSLYAWLPALMLAACAQAPSRPEVAAAPVSSDPPPPAARVQGKPDTTALPKVDLTPGLLYELMAAEVARQRGASAIAYSKYIELAERTRDPRLARLAAEIAVEDRDDEKAMRALSLWVQTDPDSFEARLNLARLLLASNRGDEAVPHLERLLATGQGTVVSDVFSQINRLLARNPDRKATLLIVEQLAAKYPDSPEARMAVARAAAAAGDDGVAVSEARAALKLRPDWEAPALLAAAVLSKSAPAEATIELKKFIAANPKSVEAQLAYARSLYGEKKYAEALAEFQRMERASPGNPDVLYPLALLALDARDYANAETYFKKLLSADVRDRNPVYLYLGQAAEEQKKYAQARDWWREIGRGEQYLPAQARIAQSFAKEGKIEEARTFLHSVVATNNQQRVQMILAEAQILRDANQNREAFDLLEKSLEKLPNHPDLLYESAMTAEKLSKLDVQETQLKKLIQLKPDYAHAYNALGYSLADRNERLTEARDLIEKALKIAPDDAAIIDSMGWVMYRLGDLPRAVELLKRAYEARPDAEIAAHLGEVLWQMNRKAEADRVWREALAKAPDDEMLKNTIKRLKR
jgi:tetratricopeptide (TPR) repeat protein